MGIERLPWEQFGLIGLVFGSIIIIFGAMIWKIMTILDRTLLQFSNAVTESTKVNQSLTDKLATLSTAFDGHRVEVRNQWEINNKAHEAQRVEHQRVESKIESVEKGVAAVIGAVTSKS